MSFLSSNFTRGGLALAAIGPFVLLSGCALKTTGGGLTNSAVVKGKAMGGSQPIVGAAVTLYATGNTGYGSTATVLGTAVSDGSGNFTITRGSNTCSDPQQVYIVASGGDPGAGFNTASVLVSALGACSAITTATSGINVNEVTTVAAAYALQGFVSPLDTTGTLIGTSSTNAQGLTHAFANAANLATIGGVANTTTAGGNGTVPNAVINTVANILASCVNSNGSCSSILLGAPTVAGAATPLNVWMEALDIARYPAYQTAALFGQTASTTVYQPTLATVPNDLSIGIAYTAGFRTDGTTATTFPWDIKADAYDNIWVSGMTNAGLVELSSTGTLLSPAAGGWGSSGLQTAFTHDLAIDTTANGNIWAADNAGYIWQYAPAGTPTAPTAGTTTQITANTVLGPIGIGVDSANNVWFGTYNGTASATQGIGQIPSGSTTASAINPYSSSAVKGTYTLFVDAANGNQIYTGSQSAGIVYQYLSPPSGPTATTSLGTSATNGLAVDKNKNLWVVYTGSGSNGGSLSKYTSGSTTPDYTCKVSVSGGAGLYNPRGLVIDGNNRFFITSYTTPGIVAFDPALGTACDAASDPGTFFTTSIGNGINPSNSSGAGIMAVSAARNETIDSSGALWTINAVSTTGVPPVVQVLGIAAPTNPVLATGKYGVTP